MYVICMCVVYVHVCVFGVCMWYICMRAWYMHWTWSWDSNSKPHFFIHTVLDYRHMRPHLSFMWCWGFKFRSSHPQYYSLSSLLSQRWFQHVHKSLLKAVTPASEEVPLEINVFILKPGIHGFGLGHLLCPPACISPGILSSFLEYTRLLSAVGHCWDGNPFGWSPSLGAGSLLSCRPQSSLSWLPCLTLPSSPTSSSPAYLTVHLFPGLPFVLLH